jgi:hypothetical protein
LWRFYCSGSQGTSTSQEAGSKPARRSPFLSQFQITASAEINMRKIKASDNIDSLNGKDVEPVLFFDKYVE